MKKKLKLDDLEITSFVTSEKESNQLKGASGVACGETMYSCLDYVTCDAVKCYLTSQSPRCIQLEA